MRLLFSFVLLVWNLSQKAALHASLQWTSLDKKLIDISSHDLDDTVKIKILREEHGGCLFDTFNVSLLTPSRAIFLAILREEISSKVPLATILPINDEQEVPLKAAIISCIINEAFCRPQIENIVANTVGNPSIQVTFTEETNMPDLSSTFQLLEALQFSPVLLGGAYGEWRDPKTLVVMIDTVYFEAIMEGINL